MPVAIPEWIYVDFSTKILSVNGDFVAVFCTPRRDFVNVIQKNSTEYKCINAYLPCARLYYK